MEFQELIEVDDYSRRTDDVKTQGSFESLMISPSTIVNLRNHGYRIPSPVQMKAIPTGLTGLDMLVQAKSGTGKTLVFSILAVENLNLQSSEVQKMIIAPTREIATQIKDTIKMIAHFKTRIALLVGGTPVHLDVQALKRGAHIVVGTAGRICQMVQNGNLNMDCIDLFVLDEADKLMDDCFQKDINYLFSALPPSRQVAVFSATYPRDLDKLLAKFMRDASLVRLNSGDVQLIGIKQYVVMCSEPALDFVLRLLKSVHFNQALIFCNHHQQCEPTCVHLEDAGFLSACISAQLPQTQRDAVIEKLKQNKLKVLVSTDLTARGIDAVNVDLVINLGSTVNVETYFHRIGRAARFGGYGAAVTLLSDFREASRFKTIALEGDLNVRILDSKRIPPDLTTNQTYFESCTHFKVTVNGNRERKRNSSHVSPHAHISAQIVAGAMDQDVKFEDNCKSYACYDRQKFLDISNCSLPLTEEMRKRIDDIGIARAPNVSPRFALAHSSGDSTKVLNADDVVKSEKPQIPKPLAVEEKKYKFVPSFQKKKRFFYMRGELLKIRESLNEATWREYALSRFDMSRDPFLPCDQILDRQKKKLSSTKESIRLIGIDTAADHKEVFAKSPLRYSRKHLIAIQNSIPGKVWLSYAKARWDTSEEPFQLDQYMRCSFEEQLRRQRQLEKKQRAEVMKSRLKAQLEKPKILAFARTYSKMPVCETSFDSFCDRINNDFQEYRKKEGLTSCGLGPVVTARDPPDLWISKVNYYTTWLRNFDSTFMYDVYKEARRKCEMAVEVNLEESHDPTLKLDVGAENQMNTACRSNCDEDLPVNSCEEQTSTGVHSEESGGEGKSSICIPQMSMPNCVSETRSLDDDKVCVGDSFGTISEPESGGKSYGGEVSSHYGEFGEVEEQFMNFVDSYRKNVNFQIVYASYMWMLRSKYH